MKQVAGALLLLFMGSAFASYDADGVPLGASEKAVLKRFPGARCKALEWQSKAADRRCDDAKAVFGGMDARITFYLRKDAVEAFDVRFDAKLTPRMASLLTHRYGKPASEERGEAERPDGAPRERVKLLWRNKAERALLVAASDKRRGSLVVSRGGFEEEIYRVR